MANKPKAPEPKRGDLGQRLRTEMNKRLKAAKHERALELHASKRNRREYGSLAKPGATRKARRAGYNDAWINARRAAAAAKLEKENAMT